MSVTSPIPKDKSVAGLRCVCSGLEACDVLKRDGSLNCRNLTKNEAGYWVLRNNPEAYDVCLQQPPEAVEVASEDAVRQLSELLTTLQNFDSSGPRSLNIILQHLKRWIETIKLRDLTTEVLQTTNILDQLNTSLSSLPTTILPIVLNQELTILHRKWSRGDLHVSPTRGLQTIIRHTPRGAILRTTYRADRSHPLYKSDTYYGAGSLVNSQVCWSRAELAREGIHSAPVAGICGSIKYGARSIIMSLQDKDDTPFYADIDMGYEIKYFGTSLKPLAHNTGTNTSEEETAIIPPRDPTLHTQILMTSLDTGAPIRVIRSLDLALGIHFRSPNKGYRYDGLYCVVDMVCVQEDRQVWLFRLVRLGGQGPLGRIVARRSDGGIDVGGGDGGETAEIDDGGGGDNEGRRSKRNKRRKVAT